MNESKAVSFMGSEMTGKQSKKSKKKKGKKTSKKGNDGEI